MKRRRLQRGWWRSDRGSYALETAIITPVFIVLLGILVAAARIQLAGGSADSAAHAAAREASLQRTAGTAQIHADRAAEQSLADSGLKCSSTNVKIDASGLSAPTGQAATVSAEVACTVALSDIGVPGLPGSKVLRSSFTSTVDQYRARR
jgi:Flp pilus assembly protein TadG